MHWKWLHDESYLGIWWTSMALTIITISMGLMWKWDESRKKNLSIERATYLSISVRCFAYVLSMPIVKHANKLCTAAVIFGCFGNWFERRQRCTMYSPNRIKYSTKDATIVSSDLFLNSMQTKIKFGQIHMYRNKMAKRKTKNKLK